MMTVRSWCLVPELSLLARLYRTPAHKRSTVRRLFLSTLRLPPPYCEPGTHPFTILANPALLLFLDQAGEKGR